MARKWTTLMDEMTPARRRRIARRVREDLTEMLLAEIRKGAGLSQKQVAEELGISQASLSQMEKQEDMQISTLRRIVEALGGELEIVAKLPTGRIAVSQFGHFSGRGAA